MPAKQTKRATGTVGEGAAGKKAKATQHAGGQSVSEKSQATRTSKNVFEKSCQGAEGVVRPHINLGQARMPNEVVIRACYGGIFDEGAGKRADVLCQRRDEGW
jgi:hypothetical protein